MAKAQAVAELTAENIRELSAQYMRVHPFAGDEQHTLETFPQAAHDGELRWRDVEWLVRWYNRRHLTSSFNRAAKEAESAFQTNDWETVETTIDEALNRDDPADRVDRLTTLAGVDVPIATGVLYFLGPTRDIVLGEREWSGLQKSGSLSEDYPHTPSTGDYERYRSVMAILRDAFDGTFIDLQRAVWLLADGDCPAP